MSDRGMRTPLAHISGLGSAKDGTKHWWLQRVTAIALIPLTVWFVASLVGLVGAGHDAVAAWLSAPLPGLLMVLFLASGFYHLRLGLQVVIEDYVHVPWAKVACLLINTYGTIALGLACVLAVLKLMMGS